MNTSEHWLETRWQVVKSEAEFFLATLTQMGCLGAFENLDIDPEKEEQKTETLCLAYFPDRADPNELKSQLKKLETPKITLLEIARIPYGDWATAWKQYFKPFALTDAIVICPSWETYVPKAHEKVLILDPGMAFGTGQHDTTKFCAEFLCDLAKQGISMNSVFDVGCGSGILSFIAKKLHATHVVGVDVDPAAIATSLENLDRNPDLGKITFAKTEGQLRDVTEDTFDVVVANIIAESLCELKDVLTRYVKPKGYLILSGILPARQKLVQENFQHLNCIAKKTSEHWHTYLYQK